MRVRLFSDIGHVMTKIDWEEPTKTKMCMYTVCWGLTFCLLLLPLWESVIVLCFVVRYFMSILVLQSS